jgi:excisionase family DNA binding protein
MNLLTVEDVAAALQLSRSKVYEIKDKIGYLKIGGAVRFKREDLDSFIEGCRPAEKAKRLPPKHVLKHLVLKRSPGNAAS